LTIVVTLLIVFMLCVLYLVFNVCQSAFCHFANKVLLLLLLPMGADDRLMEPSFSDRARDVAMTTKFCARSAKLAHPPSFIALASGHGLEYRNAEGALTAAMIPLHVVEI